MTSAHPIAAPTPARVLLGGLAAAQMAHGRVPTPHPPAATRRMLRLMLLASAAECAEARGARRGLAPLATAAGIGFVAELLGVATGRPFGAYSYSDKLGRRWREVPVLAAAAWAIMAPPAWIAAGWLSPRVTKRIPLAAGALVAWDVYLDPRMAQEGYWSWAAPGRYAGIPASNFAGWFATGCVAFAAVAALDPTPPSPADDGALALYAWTWIGEAFANAVLWRRRLPAAAGAVAMGAFAVPALLRRRRR